MNYILSPAIMFDADEELYFTKIGTDCKGKPLKYTVWGTSEEDCRIKAENLVTKLNGFNQPAGLPEAKINYAMLLDGGRLLIELTDTEAAPTFVMVNNTVYVPKQDAADIAPNFETDSRKLVLTKAGVKLLQISILNRVVEQFGGVSAVTSKQRELIFDIKNVLFDLTPSKQDATAPNLADNTKADIILTPETEALFKRPNRQPCQYCGENHADYACDEQINRLRNALTETVKQFGGVSAVTPAQKRAISSANLLLHI